MHMMRAIIICFAIVSSLFWGASSYAAPPPVFPSGDFGTLEETGQARVLQIVSPQTIQLDNGTLIDLTGVHFPDMTPEDAGPFALLGLKLLKDMLTQQEVRIYQTRDKTQGRVNRLGHALAHVVRKKDGAWVQGTLLRLGVAEMRTSIRNTENASQMRALEEKARSEKLGLWESALRILTPEETPDHIGSFQIVEGPIKSVALKKNRLYLNFGADWKQDFTVTVAPEHKREFSKTGINMLDWNGKTIRVRGWLSSLNGPVMEIDHPQAIDRVGEPNAPPKTQKTPPLTAAPKNRTSGNALPPEIPLR